MLSTGDTLYGPVGFSNSAHLWVVVSDPSQDAGSVLLVNITSVYPGRDTDFACLVSAGEHPFVRQDSCVYYERAKTASLADWSKLIERGVFQRKEPASLNLLSKIQQGFKQSSDVKGKYLTLLREQGII